MGKDSYVVCRVFQKSRAGPQNGAQYGAPFVEEDWEEEEANGVVLMPDVGDDDAIDAHDQNYLEYNDLLLVSSLISCLLKGKIMLS